MKSVLISIGPEWCEKILNGEKTIDVRKSASKELPIKVYIYETKGSSKKGRGKVIGEFICDTIEKFTMDYRQSDVNRRSKILKEACLSFEEATDYQNGAHLLYAWHISKYKYLVPSLKIYDKPKELGEFRVIRKKSYYASPYDVSSYRTISRYEPITRPPQSWQYIEEDK